MYNINVGELWKAFSEWFVGIGEFAWVVFLKPNPWLVLPAGAVLALALVGVLRRKR